MSLYAMGIVGQLTEAQAKAIREKKKAEKEQERFARLVREKEAEKKKRAAAIDYKIGEHVVFKAHPGRGIYIARSTTAIDGRGMVTIYRLISKGKEESLTVADDTIRKVTMPDYALMTASQLDPPVDVVVRKPKPPAPTPPPPPVVVTPPPKPKPKKKPGWGIALGVGLVAVLAAIVAGR